MSQRDELTAWFSSLSLSFFTLLFSLWIAKVSHLELGAKTKIGEGKVIEIVLPQAAPQEAPKPAPRLEKPQAPKVERRLEKPRVVETHQKPSKLSPPVPEERAIVEKVPPSALQERPQTEPMVQRQEASETTTQKEERAEPRTSAVSKENAEKQQKESTPAPPARINPPSRQEEDPLVGYFARVRSIVERAKRYPEDSKRRGEQGVVLVRVKVSETGKITSIELIKSSGYSRLDNETLRAIRSIGSFPPPPNGRPVEFNLEVEYKLGG